MKLQIGQTFRNLQICSILGQGGMGIVYLATHPVLQSSFVIKVLKGPIRGDPFSEARLAARIQSPHIVGVVDAGVEAGQPFIVHRYVDGIDFSELLTWLQSVESITHRICIVAKLLADVACGLHAVHQAGVVHRDIKPANLFLQGDGSALVGDFGIASVCEPSSDGVVQGTPRYMAPEVWQEGEALPSSDLYALGVTAHEMVTGQSLFGGVNVRDIIRAHVNKPYIQPKTQDRHSAEFFSLVASLLIKDPRRRASSAIKIAKQFQRLSTPFPDIDIPKTIDTQWDRGSIGSLNLTIGRRDLTRCDEYADVLVNAANYLLRMDKGVARALRKVCGETVPQEAVAQGPVTLGDVVWTRSGHLKSSWIAHAVSAIKGAICIQRATLRTLLQADQRKARVVMFPALGTGIGEVPIEVACQLMFSAFRTFAWLRPNSVQEVSLCLYDNNAFGAAQKSIALLHEASD